ncbi:hypothetical protein [Actinokineospora globicatena]|uniref:Uncharacterized protein n=1 Tax=Actinokineospora globicatena TaxID=103729 RepID=A0A9W6QNT2_9PSEU|nr:hypothetical protein [Actinokineospora globicatena]GLW91813.1 hypothetical protein Aglo03_26290 [Actinokineospora globicatena]
MADDQLRLALDDRHRGQAANLAAGQTSHRDDRSAVELALATCIRNHRPFNADDVHALVLHELKRPYNRNLVSSAMGVAAQHGYIREEPRPATPSANRTRKGSRNRHWRGCR